MFTDKTHQLSTFRWISPSVAIWLLFIFIRFLVKCLSPAMKLRMELHWQWRQLTNVPDWANNRLARLSL